jgi:hypothetical protein
MDAAQYNATQAINIQALHLLGWLPAGLGPDPAAPGWADTLAAWQQDHPMLDADGKCGPATWAALREIHAPADWLRKLPRGYAEVRAAYGGEPDVTGWAARNLVRAMIFPGTGRSVMVHKAIAAEMAYLLDVAARASGYTPADVQVYNLRKKRGGLPAGQASANWSTHSWAMAFDVDPPLNPWGNKPSSPVVAKPLFAAVFRVAGWSCGCDWNTPDTMHFQAAKGC